MPETRTVKGFSEVLLPFAEGDFEVLHLRPLGQLSVSIFVRFSFQKFAQKFVGEKTGETAKNIRF